MTRRQETNRKIVEIVAKAVELFPDWRFHQILQNIGVEQPAIDQWYEESEDTLRSINPTLRRKTYN